jgi:hypothetical protein
LLLFEVDDMTGHHDLDKAGSSSLVAFGAVRYMTIADSKARTDPNPRAAVQQIHGGRGILHGWYIPSISACIEV